jgi:hypothetical protein
MGGLSCHRSDGRRCGAEQPLPDDSGGSRHPWPAIWSATPQEFAAHGAPKQALRANQYISDISTVRIPKDDVPFAAPKTARCSMRRAAPSRTRTRTS